MRTAESTSKDLAGARLARRIAAQWWIIALCAVIAGAAAFAASSVRPELYQAKATLELDSSDLVGMFLPESIQTTDPDLARRSAAAVVQLKQPDVLDAAARLVGGGIRGGAIGSALTIAPIPDSGLIDVTAESKDPDTAKAIANATANAFIAQRVAQQRAQLQRAKSRVRTQFAELSQQDQSSSNGQQLQQRLRDVGVAEALANGGSRLSQVARRPTEAVSPRPIRDAAVGIIAGLMLGAAIALLRARLDDRIRDAAELSSIWNLPIVGLIPETTSLRNGGGTSPDPTAIEALSLTRTSLRYLQVGGKLKTVLVTSALESEGKSTITWNLAVAAAVASDRVLVVEADMRRPKLSKRLGLGGSGLAEILAGLADFDQCVQTISIPQSVGQTADVDVLPAGLTPPSPIALLEAPEAREFLALVRDRYDVVFIDTPPATVVADAVAIIGNIDALVVVSRLGTVKRGALERLRDTLEGVDANVIGQIVNSDATSVRFGYYT